MVFLINSVITLGIFVGLFFFWLWRAIKRHTITVTPALRYFVTGTVVLALPLAYTTDVRFTTAAWRVSGLITGAFFFFSCLQIRYRRLTLLIALYGVLLLVSAQAIIACQQLLMPYHAWVPLFGNRVYGAFFQPNVLASFIAAGLALTLTLLLLPALASIHSHRERVRQCGLLILLTGFSALLVCIQSRAGWLGGAVAASLLLFCFGRIDLTRTVSVATGLVGGGFLGGAAVLSGMSSLTAIDHSHSNLTRWTMLSDTLAMIANKPWLGWGYGGFEYDFQHFRIHQPTPTLVTEIARHPHNEILLWIVEGGLVGLAGVTLILAGLWCIVRQARKRNRTTAFGPRMLGVPTALCITLLPMVIHTLLEFPFYLSTLHFAVFLLLLAMADRLGTEDTKTRPLTRATSTRLAYSLATLALGGGILASAALNGQRALTQVETFGMEDITPLKTLPTLSRRLLQERISFYEQVGALLTYNQTRDEHALDGYSRWAQAYLQQRIDKNVYASLIQVLHHQKHRAIAEWYRREAALFFPTDKRFALPQETSVTHINPKKE
ncbi:Lipid A core - O-antigen ligase and related enzymes [Serratia proteamaculans]|uniref:PglL family O-oligosaccharyltransferase n=1 Tax=Serratia proteamaculans TaxID=28151 RepID=UPI00217A9C00|nr:Wzy polymerase domain-containing protein [Serratia proteamaculans]CAI2021129.1 Lipid A core - O-antigen ligase and related enzymes [Serratia proteamaculans]